jgi:predicted HTH transcriptional regulator
MKLRSTPEKTYAEFCAEVHPALLEKMHSIPIRLGSSLEDVLAYGKRDVATRGARAACFEYLVKVEKMSNREVARMFGRNDATILRVLRRYNSRAWGKL